MDAENMRMRALVRLRRKRDRSPRFLIDDLQRKTIAAVLNGHLDQGEAFDAYQGAGDGVLVQIASASFHDEWRKGETGRLDAILAALASIEITPVDGVMRIEAIVIVRPVTEAVSMAYSNAIEFIWRGMLAERISSTAWGMSVRSLKRLKDAIYRWPIDDLRAIAGIERIVAQAVASPPPVRPFEEPRPDDVTLPEILAAYRAAITASDRIRLVGDTPWRKLFHEQGVIRIGAMTITLFKRDLGARGTVAARHDDGRASDFERLRAMGPDPLHVLDGTEFDHLCDLLEALESEDDPDKDDKPNEA